MEIAKQVLTYLGKVCDHMSWNNHTTICLKKQYKKKNFPSISTVNEAEPSVYNSTQELI